LRQAEEARERARRENDEAERRKAASRPRGQASPRGSKPIRWKLEALEKRIFELEGEVARLAEALADPGLYARPEHAEAMRQEYERASAEVAELMPIWDELAEAGA